MHQYITSDHRLHSTRRVNLASRLRIHISVRNSYDENMVTCNGTVSGDVCTSVFSSNVFSRPLVHTLKYFWKGGEFARIFEFQITYDKAESWLRGVYGTNESKLSGVIDIAESELSGVIDTTELVKINFCTWSSNMILRCHWHHWVKTQHCHWHR